MRVRWLSVRDHHPRKPAWDVGFVDRLDAGAYTDPWARRIDIWAGLPYRRIVECLGHELVHAMCDDENGNQTAKQRDGEEYTARAVEAAFWPMVASLGARLPPLPKDFRKVRRAARRRAT